MNGLPSSSAAALKLKLLVVSNRLTRVRSIMNRGDQGCLPGRWLCMQAAGFERGTWDSGSQWFIALEKLSNPYTRCGVMESQQLSPCSSS